MVPHSHVAQAPEARLVSAREQERQRLVSAREREQQRLAAVQARQLELPASAREHPQRLGVMSWRQESVVSARLAHRGARGS